MLYAFKVLRKNWDKKEESRGKSKVVQTTDRKKYIYTSEKGEGRKNNTRKRGRKEGRILKGTGKVSEAQT